MRGGELRRCVTLPAAIILANQHLGGALTTANLARGRYDLIVVGLGISGGPLFEYLSRSLTDKSVLVIDRGELWDYRSTPYPLEDDLQSGRGLTLGLSTDAVLLHVPETEGDIPVAKWWAPELAGGGSVLWYGQVSRFLRSDFCMADRVGPSSRFSEVRNWPLSFDRLAPFYKRIERMLGPIGCDYGYARREYLGLDCSHVILRPSPSHFERSVIDALRAHDIRGYVGQTCLGGRAWDLLPVNPLTLAEEEGNRFPLAHRNNWYRRNYDLLVQRDDIQRVGNAYVTRLLVKAGQVRGVCVTDTRQPNCPTVEIAAKCVVLACGTLETVRILLSSDLPNHNDLLGRRISFTTERNAYLVTRIPRSTSPSDSRAGSFASVVVKDFYNPVGPDVPFKGGKVSIYDALSAEVPYRRIGNFGLQGERLQALLAHERECYVLKLSFKGESFPSADKFVELSERINAYGVRIPRVHYTRHSEDLAVERYAVDVFQRIAAAFPGSDLQVQPTKQGAALVSAHQHGGAVFGCDQSDAVLTADCECFEARNLFVVDGSFMPTSGATNSSLTLMANSLRVAHSIRQRFTRGTGGTSMRSLRYT